jgi:micrococcal nuclease
MGCISSHIEKYKLSKTTLESVNELTFEGQKFYCKVLEVYDGDTVTLCFKFRNAYFKKRCRLYGINAPEITTKNKEEKEQGYKSKDFLTGILLNQIIYFHCYGWDKYGRLLGIIFKGDEDVNDMMIKKGFAVRYMV